MVIKMMKNKILLLTVIMALILYLVCPVALAEEELEDGYFTVYEEGTKKEIFATARVVHVGDQYLNEDNDLYEVVKVSGRTAYARFKEKVDIMSSLNLQETEAMAQAAQGQQNEPNTGKKERVVAIYHTHSDESYVPTDGKASIPNNGGIYKVGDALAKALERKGIKVIHSDQSHDPHDSMAYQRSRRTAMELLKQQPDALIDVHRDATPAHVYQGEINGEQLAKTQLVVGRQNPQMETTKNFAAQLKANADKKYPGLIKGIFYGKGAYNQDLSPRAILVEAGTYTNPREDAQEGIDLMADVIATTLYGEDYAKKPAAPGGGGTTQVPGESSGATRALLWIIGLAVVGGGAYLLISTGGMKELSSKVKRFTGSEFTNFLGNEKKNKDYQIKDQDSKENQDSNNEEDK